jgi:hypothetical protein
LRAYRSYSPGGTFARGEGQRWLYLVFSGNDEDVRVIGFSRLNFDNNVVRPWYRVWEAFDLMGFSWAKLPNDHCLHWTPLMI